MKYCNKCVMPDTKPDLWFDDKGVCNACNNYDNRTSVNWEDRLIQLKSIFETYKQPHYDCIIPVSGGKDSTYQVIKVLELGYKPLCVTATTCDLTDIGRKNIENIKSLGVDYIEVSVNPKIRAKLNKIGLEMVGDISYPEHLAIFTIPIRVAVNYKIPLMIWGENSQNEYGGPANSVDNPYLSNAWLQEFGGLNGLRVDDLIGIDDITERDLWMLTYPTDEELKNVTGIFLGYFVPWDGRKNAMIAQNNGFTTYDKSVEGSCVDYENLDNYQTSIHDYFKWLKFGFGRTSDLVSMAIRRGILTRDEGLDIVKKHDGKYPDTYLGKSLESILTKIGITKLQFDRLCEKYTNRNIHVSEANHSHIID